MIQANKYFDYRGQVIDTTSLDDEELRLVDELEQFAKDHSDARTSEYHNFYLRRVGGFYERRGLSRRETTKTIVWRIAQDINGRLMIAAGLAKRHDYRDEIERLILMKYKSRRAFCEATGLSEDMLSHVLAKRKNLGIETLADALAKIGYTINITQMPTPGPPTAH
ncbi:MAG TPA: hypothetical protein VGM76_02010 [Lacipirellulaceae bacterium]|jgi:hypothetical protein